MSKLWVANEYDTLPPPEVRLIDPYAPSFEKYPTPTDDRGLIDIPALIDLVKSTVEPSYPWVSRTNVHHFYWYDYWYPYVKDVEVEANPAAFRNLPIHKGLVPRVFEEWLHDITEPAPVPAPEVMSYRVEAWNVAHDLFKMAKETVNWERKRHRRRADVALNPQKLKPEFEGEDVIGEAAMQDILDKNFRGFELHLRRNERIPVDFRFIDLEAGPHEIAKGLGKVAAVSSLKLVRKVQAA